MADAKEKRRQLIARFGLSRGAVDALVGYGFVDLLEDKKYEFFLDDLRGFLDSGEWPASIASELRNVFVDVPIKDWGKRVRKPTPRSGTITDYEAYLVEHPEDDEAWLVHADKLQEKGNPRGEYIALLLYLQREDLSAENRKEAVERLAAISPKRIDGVVPCFFIEELPDRYRLHNVHYQMDLWVVDWSKEALDEGRTKTQDNWLKWLKGKEWKLPDSLLYNAVVFEMYYWKDHPDPVQQERIDNFRQFLGGNWTMTCTRIEYEPEGKDTVIHDFGYGNKQKIRADVVGPSNVLVGSDDVSEQLICSILGIEDKKMIDEAYTWLSTKRPRIWRLEQKPNSKDLRVVVLGGLVSYFVIYLYVIFDIYVVRAFGVATQRARDFHRK
jgi:uncharacterized protein (TIGR02996 family)